MITQKRKTIYISLAVILVLTSIGIWLYSRQPVPVTDLNLVNNLAQTPSQQPASSAYVVPRVFPSETKFDLSVFKSSVFQTLRASEEVKINEDELGRENPFKKY